jgi:TRAP transporter TAXI family solute receptor
MLKKKNLIVFLIIGAMLITSFTLGGCATTPPKESGEKSGEEWAWPSYKTIATPATGTANHSIAVAWSSEFSPDTGMRVRVLPAPTSYARAEWLSIGEVDITMLQASDYIERLDGIAGYASRTAGPDDTRVIYLTLVTPWGLMVKGDSSIQTVYDIKPGTRVAWYPGSAFIMTGIEAMLELVGLTKDDVELVEVGSYAANSRVIAEGRADVTFTSPISDLNYEVAANPQGIRWLNIPTEQEDPDGFKRYRDKQSGYILATVKSGVPSAIGAMMDQAYQLYHVRADEDEEYVYQLVKWLDENHILYKDKYS